MGSGFNFFTNVIDKTPGTAGSWQDVDVSGNGVPSGATGVILKIVNTSATGRAEARKNGSSDDFGLNLPANYFRFAFVGLDENRVFEAYVGNTNIKIYLIGYCDENCGFFTNAIEKTVTADDTWRDIDASGDIPAGATGAVCCLYNDSTSTDYYVGIRKNGSISTLTRGRCTYNRRYTFQLCGVDGNRVFEGLRGNTAVHIMLIGYTKNPITFFTDPVDKSLSQTSQWTDIDVTNDTDPAADGAILFMRNSSSSTNPYGDSRKNGSSDDHSTYGRFAYNECRGAAVGLDAGQVFEGWIDNTVLDFYLIGYCKPSAILKEVTDSVGLADNVTVNKVLQITETINLVEIIQAGVGGTKKTKLFLTLGDMAVQLTGE